MDKDRIVNSAELFCGIGGFRIACDKLGITTVWANDIKSNACKVYRTKFGEKEIREGDIALLLNDIPNHDLLTAGFPCQPFSSAGKKLGVEDIRGTLFEKIAEVLHEKRPKYFLLENVKRLLTMDKGHHFRVILKTLLAEGYSIEWCLLDAKKYGLPQSRERVFIVGAKVREDEFTFLPHCELSGLREFQISLIFNEPLWTSVEKASRFSRWGVARDNKVMTLDIPHPETGYESVILRDVLEKEVEQDYYFTEDTLKRIKSSEKVNRFVNGVEILYNQKGGARMGYSIFGVNGVTPTLTCAASRHYERYRIGTEYRRLTPNEYARVQGFPKNHCDIISPYNQYALYGNAVPPIMAEWAISKLLNSEILKEGLIKDVYVENLSVCAVI